MKNDSTRTIGLFGATSVGVGAIVGGGILALAGVAFATTGPGALLVFTLNGVIAVLTALSFAEMAAAYPESGGAYTFAKKVLTVQSAFAVGWVVWFASIVAGVLYALGFGAFAVIAVQQLWPGDPPAWLNAAWPVTALALLATAGYTWSLMRRSGGGGQWINVGKVLVFGVLIAAGLAALRQSSVSEIGGQLRPFFPNGLGGLVQAMGYTFIALQGFDLIAAVAGEIRDPGRTIPKAMLASLGIALLIYLPLLFVIMTVGMAPGQTIQAASAAQPEAIIAVAAQNYLGAFGYWLVIVAALLSMLSALQANLFAASRVALTMARDRTLPYRLDALHAERGTPVAAILVTAAIVALLVITLPDVAAAGAAASLIFLITFALAHAINVLMRQRSSGKQNGFRVPGFPAVPITGALACIGLALFQGLAVPAAGAIAGIWLIFGSLLFLSLFARRARVVDAAAEARDPELARLRGHSPLVLVPIANPANAKSMVFVANALTPPQIGRVLLLSVVQSADRQTDVTERLRNAQLVLRESLTASFSSGLAPEALTTIAQGPWPEIARVAQTHHCQSLLLGLSNFAEQETTQNLEALTNQVDCDVVVLRPPHTAWQVTEVKRVLVPVGGEGKHDALRARLLTSLWRASRPEITFLRILREETETAVVQRTKRSLHRYAQEEAPGAQVEIVLSNNVAQTVTTHAQEYGLVVLGLGRAEHGRRVFGQIPLQVARQTNCGLIIISRR